MPRTRKAKPAAPACIVCRYSLTGLSESAACPECGAPIPSHSAVGNSILSHSSPDYVASLRRAAEFLIGAGALFVVLRLFGAAVDAVSQSDNRDVPAGLATVFHVLTLAVSCMAAFGWWKLAQPDPAYAGKDCLARCQLILRHSTVVALIAAIANTAALVTFNLLLTARGFGDSHTPFEALMTVSLVASVATLVALTVRLFSGVALVRAIAHRAAAPGLERSAKRLFWIVPLLFLLHQAVLHGVPYVCPGLVQSVFEPRSQTPIAVTGFIVEFIAVATYAAVWVAFLLQLRAALRIPSAQSPRPAPASYAP